MKAELTPGHVVLVGGGPGDPDLITVGGLRAIRQADVVVHDRLAPLECLGQAPDHAEIIPVGKVPRGPYTSQEQINQILIDKAKQGLRVVRFKGGDSFVFGRGGEEWQACAAAGVPVEVIPGVSSAMSVPALAGLPVTHRTLTQGFTVVSGHVPPDDPRCTINWDALAAANTTVVLLMGVQNLPEITARLRSAGLDPQTPTAIIESACSERMRVAHAQLGEVAGRAQELGVRPPAVVVIGKVAGLDLARLDTDA